jgi:glycosyltransferase involved in cell wall biosynthesis
MDYSMSPAHAPQAHVAVAHLGSRWNYDIPVLLDSLNLLSRFYTDAYCGSGSWLSGLRSVPNAVLPVQARRLQARSRGQLDAAKVTAFNLLGLEYGWRLSRVHNWQQRLELFCEINSRFNRLICSQNLPEETNVLFGMNTASLEIFEYFGSDTVRRLLDQNLVPMEIESKILAEEYLRWGHWAEDDYQEKGSIPIYSRWIEREHREWELAQIILCASPNTLHALERCGVPAHKCRIIPYPVNAEAFRCERQVPSGRPLRILFVGQVNLRKGIPYFLQTLQRLPRGSFEARAVGPIQLRSEALRPFEDLCTFTGAVPRAEMPQHYAWADLFLFPSLCDSAPGATNEALAAGLPVVTTFGAGTVVDDGVEGFVLPDRDVDALVDTVEQLITDPERLFQLSINARRKAEAIDIRAYGQQLQKVFNELLIEQPSESRSN